MNSTIAKCPLTMPVALAPTGATGLSHWEGDIAAGRAAENAGIRMILSTASSYTLEEVAQATEQSHWFQLYPFGDHARVGSMIRRAKQAGYSALFVTVDVPVLGNREDERRTGMGMPLQLTPKRAVNLLKHVRWLRDVLRHQRVAAIHYLEPHPDADTRAEAPRAGVLSALQNAARSASTQARYMQGDLRWEDLAWMRDQWAGPFYVKGILDPDDAAFAVNSIGADGIVVSNHGGRQLGCAVASLDALPAIVDRVGDRAEVYMDGGIRRGTDVITALCLGARGVFVGRPYLYGLAGAGEAGVTSVLEILRSEIQRALVLMGCPSIETLDRTWLVPSPGSSSRVTDAAKTPG